MTKRLSPREARKTNMRCRGNKQRRDWGNIYTEDMTDSYRRHSDDTKTRKRNTKKLTDIKELNSRLNYINVNLEHLHNATERIMYTK